MDSLVRDLMKDGMAISEIMNMPFTYIVDILKDKNEQKQNEVQSGSFFDLLG